MTIYLTMNERIALFVALLTLIVTAIHDTTIMYTAYRKRRYYEMARMPRPNWLRITHIFLLMWPAEVLFKILFG